MFFSEFILTKSGALAKIWLAAHWDKKLTKNQVQETSIEKSAKDIVENKIPIALRTSGHLLLGVVKIYSRKVRYVLAECNDAMTKYKLQAVTNVKVDLPEKSNQATLASITLPDNFSYDRDIELVLPECDLDALFNDEDFKKRMENLLQNESGIGGEISAPNLMNNWEVESTQSFGSSKSYSSSTLKSPGKLMDMSDGVPKSDERPRFESQMQNMNLEETIDFGFDVEGLDEDKRRQSNFMGATPMEGIEENENLVDDGGDVIQDLDMNMNDQDTALMPPPKRASKKSRKRSRPAQWDDDIEISKEEFKSNMDDTSDIVYRRKKAPKHRLESSFQDKSVMIPQIFTTKEMLQNPLTLNPSDIREDVLRIYNPLRKGKKKKKKKYDENEMEDEGEEDLNLQEDPDDIERSQMMVDDGGDVIPDLDLDNNDLDDIPLLQSDKARRMTKTNIDLDDMDLDDSLDDNLAPQTEEEREQLEIVKSKVSARGFTKKTMNFLAKFKLLFESSKVINLNDMIREKNRKTACQAFYQILELSNKGLFKPTQEESWGNVFVVKTEQFYRLFPKDDSADVDDIDLQS